MAHGFKSRAQRAIAAFASFLVLAAVPSAVVGADLRVLVNTDANAATGCTVATANGAFAGVERRFVATVDTTQDPPRVTGITQENCTAAPATFGAPVSVSAGGWAVGIGNGTSGANVIETGLPSGPGPAHLGIEYVDAVGQDAVTAAAGGGPIIASSHAPGHAEPVPTLSDAMLLLLVLLVVAAGWRYGRRHLHAAPLAVVALALVTTLAWAAIVLDGLTSDWAGISPAATDGADAPDGADITAVFATIEGATLFVRVDARTGMPPAAVADAYTATAGTPLAIATGAGLLANDTRGVPAANVTSFGGGTLGGAATTNAAGATVAFGAGGTLMVNADGSFAFNPPAGFTGAFTFSYRIGNGNGTSDAVATITAQQAPAFTSANAATFNVGSPATFTVAATGFPAPTLALAGALPAGIAFDPATGALSGTPAAGTAGTYPLVFTATNGVSPDATQNFTLTVTQAVAITSANAATFTVATAGTFTITTSATPTATSIVIAGALPSGVTLGATSGTGTAVLSGTPAAGTGGTYVVTITASNAGITADGTQTFTLTVNEAAAITSANAATFLAGSAGTHTVTATGFPAPTRSMSGPLPIGVTFDAASGVLSGTPGPGSAGTYPLVFTAANGVAADATQNFTLTVSDSVLITSANAATFIVGTPGTFTVTTSGTPPATGVTATGALPPGVTFTNNVTSGLLAGTPAGGTGGIYTLTINATNGIPPAASQAFTLTVHQAAAITSAAAATFSVGQAGTFTVTATGFPAPAFSTAGPLPPGVTLDAAGNLAGTPAPGAAAGSPYIFTVVASNGVIPDSTQNFTLAVDDPAVAVDDAYTVAHDNVLNVAAPAGLLANDAGIPAPSLVAVNGSGANVGAAAATPNGSVTVNADGSFAYTPAANFAGTDTFTYGIQNAAGSATGTVTITITNLAPVVDLNGAAAGIDFAAAFTESAGPVPIADAAALTVADGDDAELTGATVRINNLLDGASETLAVTCPDAGPGCSGAIQLADVAYTAASGTLEILATAPVADFQALLRTLAYNNASATPDGTPRDITITINDGIADNAPVAHAIVAIAGVNQLPVITAPATASTPVDTAHVFVGTVSVADPDAAGADVKVTLTATNGTATLATTAGLAVTGNGTALVTATGPLASQNAALNGMSFQPAGGYSGAASLRIDVDDLGNTGTGGALTDTHTIAITVDNLPAVTTTIPAAGAASVSTTGTLTVNFNEPVNFSAASFALECPVGAAQALSLSASPSASVVLTPTASLPPGTACRLTVVAAQLTDSVGQNPAADTVVSFTTNSLPTVTSTVPANGAAAVQLAAAITVAFSESVNATAAAFMLECPSGSPVAFTASASPATSFTLTPAANLPAGTTCAAGIGASQVTDVDGGQAMAADYGFTFTTGTPPAITSGAAATFTVGTAGSFAVTTTGTPTITSLAMASVAAGPGGALPAGVSFSYASGASGLLSGTATNAAHVGTYQLSFTASNGITPDALQSPFTLTLQCPAITLAPAAGSTLTAAYNAPFAQAFAATGGTAPYSYSLGGTALPNVSFSGANLSGIPSNTGSFAFTVQATDTYGCTSAAEAYTLNVNPTAGNDGYSALGNVLVNSSTGTPFSVVANDAFPAGATISAFDAASAQGGAVTMTTAAGASLGRFTYDPPTGYTGTDTFTYTLSSNGRTATGTVTFTVSGMVWFIDSNAAACASNCDGRMTHPFTSTGTFQAQNTGAALKPAANHPIFVHSSPTSYAGNVTLLAGQRLVGQGATSTLAALAGATPLVPAAGQVLPSTGGTPPTLAGSVAVQSNNFIHGLTLGGNVALTGATFGTLTLTENVAVNTAGGGVSLATGVLAGGFTGVTSSGGAANIALADVTTGAATFGFGSGALSGATGDAFSISGGNGSFTYGGTITNTAALAVNIQNKTGGTVTLSGSVNPAAPGRGILVQNNGTGTNTITFSGAQKRISSGANAGVALANNAGATIAFTGGGLAIATTTGAGFTATGGAAGVTVAGNGNTIASTGGTALNVVGTAIGGANLNFLSIAANGGASGIVLENTGLGALVVSGAGSTAVGGDASGGTIQNTTSYGIRLTNTRNTSLANMTIQATGRSGIDGLGVTNFAFANGTINNSGTAAAGQFEESNIAFNDGGAFLASSVDGAVSITNSILTNARRHGVQIENGSGTLASLTISGNTLTSSASAAASLGTAILVMPQGSAATAAQLTTATIANNTITNFPSGEGIFVGGGVGSASNGTSSVLGANGTPIAITGNRIDGGAARMGSNAIRATFNGQNGVANFNIANNNPVTNIQGQGVSVFMGGTVTGTTTVSGNTIVANQTLLAGTQGLAVQVDDGPAGLGTSAADYNFVITNNNVSNYEGFGIRAIARASLGKMDLTITGNTVGTPIMANRNGIRVDSGSAVGDVTVCLGMSGNTSDGSGVNQGMGIRKQGIVSTTNEFGIAGLAPSPTTAANAAAFVSANNPSGGGTDPISGDNYVSCTITP